MANIGQYIGNFFSGARKGGIEAFKALEHFGANNHTWPTKYDPSDLWKTAGALGGGALISGMLGGPGLNVLAAAAVPVGLYAGARYMAGRNNLGRGASMLAAGIGTAAIFGTPSVTRDLEEATGFGSGSMIGPGIIGAVGYGLYRGITKKGNGFAGVGATTLGRTLSSPFEAAHAVGSFMTGMRPSMMKSGMKAFGARVGNTAVGAGMAAAGLGFWNLVSTGNMFGQNGPQLFGPSGIIRGQGQSRSMFAPPTAFGIGR